MDFKKEAFNVKSDLIKIRRHLHEYPELSTEEVETSKFIKKILKKEKIEFKEYFNTGIAAVIKGTLKSDKREKTIGVRADIDALPIEEKNRFEYSSKNSGVMHACGHDAHTTILLGVAMLLNKNKHLFHGNIKLIFEPAEETVGGARYMIKENVLDDPKVDAMIGLHVEETLECGKIMFKDGVVNAASNPFKIKIKGEGGHGAYPHRSVDSILIASNIIISLQSIVSREINTMNPAVITVGKINGGSAQNIIPEEVEFEGIIRTMNKEDRDLVKKRLVEVSTGIAKTLRGEAIIEIEESYPNLYNNEEMVKMFYKSSKSILEEHDIIKQYYPKMGVESFAYFAEKVPSVFYFLGSRNEISNIIYPAHSSLFDVDEDCIPLGVALQCQMIIDYLTS